MTRSSSGVGRSMRLTPRAQEMQPQIEQICSEIERLFEPEIFDPATVDISFVVAAPDSPGVLAQQSAPRATTRRGARGPDPVRRSSAEPARAAPRLHHRPRGLRQLPHLAERRIQVVVLRARRSLLSRSDHPLAKRTRVRSADLVEVSRRQHVHRAPSRSRRDAKPHHRACPVSTGRLRSWSASSRTRSCSRWKRRTSPGRPHRSATISAGSCRWSWCS